MSEQNGHPENSRPSSVDEEKAETPKEKAVDAMSEEELLAAIEGESADEAPAEEKKGFANPLEALAAENHKLDEEIAE